MLYAVLQTGLEPPSTEQLKHGYRDVPGLAEFDALTLGRDAFGILAKGFELERATILKDSLAAQGVGAEVVEDASLPVLPDLFHLSRLEHTEKNLLVYDALGRVAEVDWQDIWLIAAGTVVTTEFKQVRVELGPAVERGIEFIKRQRSPAFGRKNDLLSEIAAQAVPNLDGLGTGTREERHDRLMLEIILAGAVTRYTINAERIPPLLFQYLGARLNKDLVQNFALLVQDLSKAAPDADINRGARLLRENAGTQFRYANKTAFHNEMVWLLWRRTFDQRAS